MKTTLLALHTSGRLTRSVTRRLTHRFIEAWSRHHPEGVIVHRDLVLTPPSAINEKWISAAFAEPAQREQAMHDALAASETLINEIESADAIVLGVPMYNFGMPAVLKLYLDQIVRVDRTFAYAPATAERYRPLLESKPMVVVTSAGDSSLLPGGELAHLNFLEPHLLTVLGFIGLHEVSVVRVGDEQSPGEQRARTLVEAEMTLDELAAAVSTC